MKRLIGTLCGVGLIVLGLSAGVRPAGAADPAAPDVVKNIDLAICLDVSGSMGGLIQSAKVKLWDIVNDLGKIKPAPNFRVALYSYGHTSYDRNAGWVRKEADLTSDLDSVYQKLNALTINGGDEYVARVCRDAVDQQKWSEDPKALKIIFVCGNEPASQDPVVKLKEAAAKAGAKGIVINTIFCGPAQSSDASDWKEFAALAGGRFASIDHDRGTVAVATPMDKELAELGAKLNNTYVVYGGAKNEARKENQAAQDANAQSAGAPAQAARSVAKAGALYRNEEWDLVDRLKRDKQLDVKKIPDAELSDEMKKMTPEQREAHVKEMAAKREALQKQIVDLNAKRTTYIAEEMKKNPNKGDKAFDTAIRGALREQAAGKGILIPD